jgi:nicotinamide mononucleotide transporter
VEAGKLLPAFRAVIETFGFVTGVANVWLLARQNIWNWPVGLANNVAYLILFATTGLYGDAGLQVVYIVLSIYGWWNWARRGSEAQLPVTRTPTLVWNVLAPVTIASFVVLRWFLAHYTDSTVPVWDGLTTALSLAAIYGQSQKYLESWWIWILADLVYIPLYIYKGLWLTSVLYLVFLALCVFGLRQWMRELTGSPAMQTQAG